MKISKVQMFHTKSYTFSHNADMTATPDNSLRITNLSGSAEALGRSQVSFGSGLYDNDLLPLDLLGQQIGLKENKISDLRKKLETYAEKQKLESIFDLFNTEKSPTATIMPELIFEYLNEILGVDADTAANMVLALKDSGNKTPEMRDIDIDSILDDAICSTILGVKLASDYDLPPEAGKEIGKMLEADLPYDEKTYSKAAYNIADVYGLNAQQQKEIKQILKSYYTDNDGE